MSRNRLLITLGAGLLAVACTGAPGGLEPGTDATPSPVPSPVVTPSPSPVVTPPATPSPSPVVTPPATPSPSPVVTPAPTPDGSPSGVIVTFDVEGEQFRILVTEETLIAHVGQLLAGGEEGRIPSGLIVRGETGVNEGWSWSIDPDSLEFADMTMEVCDGLPSHIEDGTLSIERYCPWGAQVIDVQPAP